MHIAMMPGVAKQVRDSFYKTSLRRLSWQAILENPANFPQSRPQRMVIVDDNLDALESTKMLLELHGHGIILPFDADFCNVSSGSVLSPI
ncbi:hypothetical protein [Caballeronia sp. KNU42]